MTDELPAKVVLQKTKKENGYTIRKSDSNIPTNHFQALLASKIMTGFKAKDRDTGEIRKDKNGKDIWINYISNEKYGELETYCSDNNMVLEVNEAPPVTTS